MVDRKRDKDSYIEELESKIVVLENENAQFAERSEDALLLGIVYEHINALDDIDGLLMAGLEKISILKNIPFCACCRKSDKGLIIGAHYFLHSNETLVSRELIFSGDVEKELQDANPVMLKCENDMNCPVVEFETLKYFPESLLIIPSRSELRDTYFFCFAIPGKDKKLLYVAPLVERIVEMIATRIDTLLLMTNLRELNWKLDQRVRERTKELKHASTGLRKSQQKFQNLFNAALDMIHFVDAEGRLIDANPAELETLQYSKEEYLEMRLDDIIDPAHLEATKKALSRVIAGEEVRNYQTVMIAKDGTRVEVEVNAVPEMDREKVVGSMAILRDITERKHMEEQLLKIRKMESVGLLAGGIAHDFNNILAAILGNISLAIQLVMPEDKVRRLLSEAEKASLRAKELTHQLLTFSKGGEPVREVSSIVDVIKDSASFVLRGTNIACNYTFAEDLWPVAIDRGQISQVIQNLVINARHAMPMGGEIVVTCENFHHENPQALPLETGRYIKLSIKDSGIGIPRDHIDRIFDPYFTTKQEGSGLGLAVTHSIIVKHQGLIEVESQDQNGSIFTIYLPASSMPEQSVPVEKNVEPLNGRGKILLMDDDEMVRDIAGEMLSYAGYEVITANSGEEAVEVFQKENSRSVPIEAVILDLTIPAGMGGKDAAEILHEMNPDIPLIVSSGYSNDPVMGNYKKYGFSAAIIKPFQFDELLSVLQKVLV